jgi:hypothetical protein
MNKTRSGSRDYYSIYMNKEKLLSGGFSFFINLEFILTGEIVNLIYDFWQLTS